jgi:hypothetical protein
MSLDFFFPPQLWLTLSLYEKTVRWLQLLELRNEIDIKHLWIPHIPEMLRQVLYFTEDSVDSQFWAIQAEHSTTVSPSKQQPISTSHSLILRRHRCSKCMQHHDADASSSKSAASTYIQEPPARLPQGILQMVKCGCRNCQSEICNKVLEPEKEI